MKWNIYLLLVVPMAWSVFSKSGDMDHVVLDEFPREGVDIVESLLHPAQGEM